MQKDPVKEIERRTQRYWYQDGIWEIAFGLAYLVLSGFFFLVRARSWEGSMGWVLLLVQAVLFVGIFSLMGPAVRLLKERITYPRTGYVAYRKPAGRTRLNRAVRAGIIAAVTGGVVAVAAAAQSAVNMLPLIVGIVMSIGIFYIGYRFKLLRLYAVGVLTIILGTVLAVLSISEDLLAPYFFGGMGLLMMTSGTLTLLMYLRSTRPADEQDDYLAPDGPSGAP